MSQREARSGEAGAPLSEAPDANAPQCEAPWPGPIVAFHSPDRLTIGDVPVMLGPDGQSLSAVIGALILMPRTAEGALEVWSYLFLGGNASKHYRKDLQSFSEFSSMYSRWLACPEKVAWEELNWRPLRESVPRVTEHKRLRDCSEITLDDLGDLT